MNLYTIGHSNYSLDEFYALLSSQNIDCIIDVRSMPYSKYASQFNKENIKLYLNSHNVLYAHLGDEFGARRSDCLVPTEFAIGDTVQIKNQVNFELGVKTENFQKGVKRLTTALEQGRNVSLMCSEADPLECHRFSFLSRYFYDQGWNVMHIMKDKDSLMAYTLGHKTLEKQMIDDFIKHRQLRLTDEQEVSLFPTGYTSDEQRRDAYRLKNKLIGYIMDLNDNVMKGI